MPPRSTARLDLAFCAALSLVLAALWLAAVRIDGSWTQVPFWDSAWFHVRALRIHREMESDGLEGLVHAWTRSSGTHAPLVPALSALSMFAFGESRLAAEIVLPLSVLLFVVSVFRCVARLYGRPTAFAATALSTTFPVFLTYTRAYYFEAPAAALFAAACWALLASDRFARWMPTLAFGALAGLTALARSAGGVYLAGPALVGLALALRAPDRWRRIARLAVATALAVALAATWYVPNLGRIFGYLHQTTYGPNAEIFAGGRSAFSPASFLYYAQWCVLDGPGVPMTALALAGAALAVRANGPRSLASPAALALASVFAIDFVLVLVGAQRMGGKFLLPLMPIVAVAIVRAVAIAPRPNSRLVLALGVAACALHHLVACTFAAPRPAGEPPPELLPFPSGRRDANEPLWLLPGLWNHANLFVEWSRSGGGRTDADYRIPEIVDRLAAMELDAGARVSVVGNTAFFEAATLNLEALARRRDWLFEDRPGPTSDADALDRGLRALAGSGAVVVRGGGPAAAAFARLNDGAALRFEEPGTPVTLGDSTSARVLRRAR